MARNIEIKARVSDAPGLAAKVAALAQQGPTLIEQDDTFFRCANGRLKLRAFADGTGELIFYRRADHAGPKESFYVRSFTPDPDSLRETLTLADGQAGRVRKRRQLYLIGRTRVHLDEVEQLGHFMELEVVLADGESAEDGIREAQALMASLGIAPEHLVEQAYVDLVESSMRVA
jgi:predicted adenylyl cyclase CyaB